MRLGGSLYRGPMPNSADCARPNRPGPKPQFPHRIELRLRNDQRQALVRIAASLNVGVSDLVRHFIDTQVEWFEGHPVYQEFKERMSNGNDHH